MTLSSVAPASAGFKYCIAEGLTELERHDVVEDGVDDGGYVVEDARDVVQHSEGCLQGWSPVGLLDVYHHQSLRVERSPANKKRNHNRNCNEKRENGYMRADIGKTVLIVIVHLP